MSKLFEMRVEDNVEIEVRFTVGTINILRSYCGISFPSNESFFWHKGQQRFTYKSIDQLLGGTPVLKRPVKIV